MLDDVMAKFDAIFIFACKNGHKVYRRSLSNPAPCSRCGRAFALLKTVERQANESREAQEIRVAGMRT